MEPESRVVKPLVVGFCLGLQDMALAPKRLYDCDGEIVAHRRREARRHQRSRQTRASHIRRHLEDSPSEDTEEERSLTPSMDSRSSLAADSVTSSSSRNVIGPDAFTVGLGRPLWTIATINAGILFVCWIVRYVALTFIGPVLASVILKMFGTRLPLDVLATLLSLWPALFIGCLEILNLFYLKEILDKIHSVQQKKASQSKGKAGTAAKRPAISSVGLLFMDRIFAFVFLTCLLVQAYILCQLVGNTNVQFVINLVHMSLLYSLYAFEYRWCYEGLSFEYRLNRITRYWPYLLGYGLPLGLVSVVWPGFCSLGHVIVNLTYPVLVAGAERVPWETRVRPSAQLANQKWASLPAYLVCRPSLVAADQLMKWVRRIGECWRRR